MFYLFCLVPVWFNPASHKFPLLSLCSIFFRNYYIFYFLPVFIISHFLLPPPSSSFPFSFSLSPPPLSLSLPSPFLFLPLSPPPQVASYAQTWSLFVWPPNYLCSGEEDYFTALFNLSDSILCPFQNFLSFFFTLYAEWWVGMVLFFTTTLMSTKAPFFISFFLNKKGERIIHLLGILVAFLLSLGSTIGAQIEVFLNFINFILLILFYHY